MKIGFISALDIVSSDIFSRDVGKLSSIALSVNLEKIGLAGEV